MSNSKKTLKMLSLALFMVFAIVMIVGSFSSAHTLEKINSSHLASIWVMELISAYFLLMIIPVGLYLTYKSERKKSDIIISSALLVHVLFNFINTLVLMNFSNKYNVDILSTNESKWTFALKIVSLVLLLICIISSLIEKELIHKISFGAFAAVSAVSFGISYFVADPTIVSLAVEVIFVITIVIAAVSMFIEDDVPIIVRKKKVVKEQTFEEKINELNNLLLDEKITKEEYKTIRARYIDKL